MMYRHCFLIHIRKQVVDEMCSKTFQNRVTQELKVLVMLPLFDQHTGGKERAQAVLLNASGFMGENSLFESFVGEGVELRTFR